MFGYSPEQPWRTQYRFDVERGTIAEPLTATPAEALVALACALGGDTGEGLTRDMARRHPMPRMRGVALDALARHLGGAAGLAVLETAADDPDRHVAARARARIAALR